MTRRIEAAVELLTRMSVTDMVSARVPFGEAPKAYALVDEHPEQVLGALLDYA
jgi:hypothetical protein